MNPESLPPDDLHKAGLRALSRELGPIGMLRFIQIYFAPGKGDYTAERHQWLSDDPAVIMREMQEMEEKGELYPK